jgi:hypothetical protein
LSSSISYTLIFLTFGRMSCGQEEVSELKSFAVAVFDNKNIFRAISVSVHKG